jgi:hypothetical protein
MGWAMIGGSSINFGTGDSRLPTESRFRCFGGRAPAERRFPAAAGDKNDERVFPDFTHVLD